MIRTLTPSEMASAEFAHLLWLAVEVDDDALRAILTVELPHLRVVGAVDKEHVIAFGAFDADTDPVVIEYIAVSESAQGRGLGRALIETIRELVPGRAVFAETDDDAVDFYHRIGFEVTRKSVANPRWPERQRYECVLG